jgi:O-antigen ligase
LVGFAEALYGLLIYFGGDELGLWNPGQAQVTISGTYVNQNHFAGLIEMTIPVGMGLLLSIRPDHGRLTDLKEITRYLSAFVLGQRGVILFCILVMTAALILTNSRGGTGALAIGVTVAIAISVMKKGIRARELKLGLLVSSLVIVAIFWLGSGQFTEKLQVTGLSSDRGDLRELTYRMINDSPMIGTGLGTYRWIFPAYKDERFGSYFYEHAHNDYLEVLSEQGLIGFSLLVSGVLLILISLMRAFGRRRDPLVRGALFAAIAGSVSFMIHGLVDFNFQIPANACYFFVLLGLGTVASSLRRKPGASQVSISER